MLKSLTAAIEGDKDPVGSSPEELRTFIAAEAVRLAARVKISGAKMD